jgi:hypothetical protein
MEGLGADLDLLTAARDLLVEQPALRAVHARDASEPLAIHAP